MMATCIKAKLRNQMNQIKFDEYGVAVHLILQNIITYQEQNIDLIHH